ncbi:MAG: tetratricopeptide repeat protein [Treponema sp.]|nr:tetratricopeptide repeat protein [Treponema sp.]
MPIEDLSLPLAESPRTPPPPLPRASAQSVPVPKPSVTPPAMNAPTTDAAEPRKDLIDELSDEDIALEEFDDGTSIPETVTAATEDVALSQLEDAPSNKIDPLKMSAIDSSEPDALPDFDENLISTFEKAMAKSSLPEPESPAMPTDNVDMVSASDEPTISEVEPEPLPDLEELSLDGAVPASDEPTTSEVEPEPLPDLEELSLDGAAPASDEPTTSDVDTFLDEDIADDAMPESLMNMSAFASSDLQSIPDPIPPEPALVPPEPAATRADDLSDENALNSLQFDENDFIEKDNKDQANVEKDGLIDLDSLNLSSEVEEIILSEQDLASLQKTLSSYPLNLRVACEELIAEQEIDFVLMPMLVKALVGGAPARETAALVGKIAGRIIRIPPGFEKKSGAELEAERRSFSYIFIYKFLPAFRLFIMLAIVAASLFYLGHRFIYIPLRAESIYQLGYERIGAGDYMRANDRFREAFALHRNKNWFYRYAEAFRDKQQYTDAEEKYDGLLLYYPRDKKAALDYANMETNHLFNYQKADSLIRENILDHAVNDREALLARGDNALDWGGVEPEKYETAQESFARYIEYYGHTDPLDERMLKYFIRTDNLGYVIPLQHYFMEIPDTSISASTLSELGEYLLDKKIEKVSGVPDEYIDDIDGINDVLLRSVRLDPTLPEPHYHLARYYNYLQSALEERVTLETALKAFDATSRESVKLMDMRIDAERRYANLLASNREFIPAEVELLKAINLYEDAVARNLFGSAPQYGRLYAEMGDLAYFTYKDDSYLNTSLEYYTKAEQNGWATPELQYRMGAAYYQSQQWGPALEYFVKAASDIPYNRRILNSLGAAAFMRGDYFLAQGYYKRLLELLESERARFPMLLPNEREDHQELLERIMVAQNNLGVTLESLTESTGNSLYRANALGLYAESARVWDLLSRNPQAMTRSRVEDIGTPGTDQASLNSRNTLYPVSGYRPKIYSQIDKDMLEPSWWEGLTPRDTRISDPLFAATR